MILHGVPHQDPELLEAFRRDLMPVEFQGVAHRVFVISSCVKTLDERYGPLFAQTWTTNSDIQLASREYIDRTRSIQIRDLVVGGDSQHTVLIAGPCSVESREQLFTVCRHLVSQGVRVLRGGAFKPRTSPYTFQGLGQAGLELLKEARQEFGLAIASEVRDSTHVDAVLEAVDVVQVGAKAMYDHGILRACGQTRKPVLLKRGFGTTLQEFVQAAEFILSGGNDQVLLCERGIRTFETKTRFTLDLCGVAYLKEHTNLPVVVDPSHAMGYRYGVPGLARAATALGVDGLLIETHPNPSQAKSDAAQQLDLETLLELRRTLIPIAEAVGRKLV